MGNLLDKLRSIAKSTLGPCTITISGGDAAVAAQLTDAADRFLAFMADTPDDAATRDAIARQMVGLIKGDPDIAKPHNVVVIAG